MSNILFQTGQELFVTPQDTTAPPSHNRAVDVKKEISLTLKRYVQKRMGADEASQEEFAQKLGRTRVSVQQYISQTRPTSFKIIENIVENIGPRDWVVVLRDLSVIAGQVHTEMALATEEFKEGGKTKLAVRGDIAEDIRAALEEMADEGASSSASQSPERSAPGEEHRPGRRTRHK